MQPPVLQTLADLTTLYRRSYQYGGLTFVSWILGLPAIDPGWRLAAASFIAIPYTIWVTRAYLRTVCGLCGGAFFRGRGASIVMWRARGNDTACAACHQRLPASDA